MSHAPFLDYSAGAERFGTSPEEHPPEESVFSDELVVERDKHVQNDEANYERRNIVVRHPSRMNQEGGGVLPVNPD